VIKGKNNSELYESECSMNSMKINESIEKHVFSSIQERVCVGGYFYMTHRILQLLLLLIM